MRSSRSTPGLLILSALAAGLFPSRVVHAGSDAGPAPPGVRVLEVPDGGIQPQAVVDDRGAIHLIFFKGDPAGGDLFHARLDPGARRFSTPVRVNSRPGSAIAIGTIRGGQIAVGRGGRIHVAWNGSNGARPRNPAGGDPMLYTRSDAAGKGFEPQRNLMRKTSALDGGGTVAADREGNVYVAWHGRTEDAGPGEAGRRMWVVRSKDDGATFTAEERAVDHQTGACACCGTRALAGRDGTVYLLYRAATGGVDRDMSLLHSEDHGGRFDGGPIAPWRAEVCPMSSAAMTDTDLGVLAAWETKGEVFFARIDPRTHRASPPVAPPGGKGNRKHPAVAGNARGDAILVWAEGTGWQKGGALAWQVFDRDGRPNGPSGRIEAGVPVWGLGAVVAQPDGAFAIIHSGAADAQAGPPRGRDPMLRMAAAVFHPRVARLARKLDEASNVGDAAVAARELLGLDSEVALDVVANYAAQSPLRAFDREHRVLVLLDGRDGWFTYAAAARPRAIKSDPPPGVPPEAERLIERETAKLAAQISWKQKMDPPIPWAAAFRLPDGAVTEDEGGSRDCVGFLFVPRDGKSYHYLVCRFRGPDPAEDSAIHDARDAQLRRWKASDWWPKEWR